MSPLSPTERRGLILSVGTHRGKRPLSPVEVAQLFQRMLDNGSTLSDIAELVQFDGTTMIGRFQRLLGLAPPIQHLVVFGTEDGALGFTSAFELARLPSADHQEVAMAVLEHGLSSAEVRQVVQLRLRSRRPVDDCISEVVGMRREVVTRHIFIGAVTDEGVRARLNGLTQAERNSAFGQLLGEHFASLRLGAGRLGVDRFTLVGGQELHSTAKEELERDINRQLAARIH